MYIKKVIYLLSLFTKDQIIVVDKKKFGSWTVELKFLNLLYQLYIFFWLVAEASV